MHIGSFSLDPSLPLVWVVLSLPRFTAEKMTRPQKMKSPRQGLLVGLRVKGFAVVRKNAKTATTHRSAHCFPVIHQRHKRFLNCASNPQISQSWFPNIALDSYHAIIMSTTLTDLSIAHGTNIYHWPLGSIPFETAGTPMPIVTTGILPKPLQVASDMDNRHSAVWSLAMHMLRFYSLDQVNYLPELGTEIGWRGRLGPKRAFLLLDEDFMFMEDCAPFPKEELRDDTGLQCQHHVAICIAAWHWKDVEEVNHPAPPLSSLMSLTKTDSGRVHGQGQHRYDVDHCYPP